MKSSVDVGTAEREGASAPFWLRPTSYWMPAHFPISAWTTHGAFAAWLVDVLRPQRIVELGTHYGYSCFAFAEAAKRLGLATTVDALDSWEGDDHAGHYGQEVFDAVHAVVEADYPDRVRMIRGLFAQSRHLFDDASIDVLHIDGRHGYEDVVADYEEWRSVVRDGGVILFHDIAEHDNGFGVWRLWEEIAEPGRSFAFDHGHGLGVLAIGEIADPPLRELFEADDATASRIRADFERLGSGLARQSWLETVPADAERAWAEVRRRAVHEDELQARIDALTGSTSWRLTAPVRGIGRLVRRR
ncbi:class I SAM-dependent methyltransferase [Microbacterium sp. NPDC056044]|uniref:class I SAM-dependent methyltransferase n=1 Tax=Microbacterium sp. NPDC056044 TaxID=3345690 RepID=UPI0035D82C6A